MKYPSKTDRNAQWVAYKEDSELSRAKINLLQNYFETGKLEKIDTAFGEDCLLFMNPNQNIPTWQSVLSDLYKFNWTQWIDSPNDLEERARNNFFVRLQRNFLGFITNYQFHPEDQAWIFTQIFGETYNPDRKFPLLLPGEDEYRVISLTPLEIIRSFSVCFRSLFRVGNKSSFAFAMYLVGYFGSLVPYIPIDVYQVASPKNKNLKVIWDSLKYIFHYAHQDTSSASEDDVQKIQLARTLKSCFDNYQGDKGDYEQLVALVEKEGLQIPVYE